MGEQYLIRVPGQLGGIADIGKVVVVVRGGVPLRL